VSRTNEMDGKRAVLMTGLKGTSAACWFCADVSGVPRELRRSTYVCVEVVHPLVADLSGSDRVTCPRCRCSRAAANRCKHNTRQPNPSPRFPLPFQPPSLSRPSPHLRPFDAHTTTVSRIPVLFLQIAPAFLLQKRVERPSLNLFSDVRRRYPAASSLRPGQDDWSCLLQQAR
jgi:hypothetical protein